LYLQAVELEVLITALVETGVPVVEVLVTMVLAAWALVVTGAQTVQVLTQQQEADN
jgi:hypothetical protein